MLVQAEYTQILSSLKITNSTKAKMFLSHVTIKKQVTPKGSGEGQSISSLRANSELNLALTASQNGVLYRRGFPKAQEFGAIAVHHDDQRA